jgi:hypothetical protein
MKRMIRFEMCVVAVFLLAIAVPGGLVHAQTSVTVTDGNVQYSFGSDLQITANFISDTQPSVVYIILQPTGQKSRQVKLVPGLDGSLDFRYDLNQDPLLPFSRIYYWYQFEFQDNVVLTSPSFWFDYADNRYQWKQTSSKLFQVFWQSQPTTFGQQIIEIATTGLERATTILPIAPEFPISIYVYPNIAALQDALDISGQSWVAGHASPELGVALVSDGSESASRIEFERQIPHELMHILQYQMLGSSYEKAPAWLLEGLATLAQSYPNPDDDRILTAAVNSNHLIPLDSMCRSMPLSATDTILGYAQSMKLVHYLEQNFGSQVFTKMLQSSSNGLSCDQILTIGTGLNSDQLLVAWLDSEYPEAPKPSQTDATFLFYVLGGIGLIIIAFIAVREILKKRKTKITNG